MGFGRNSNMRSTDFLDGMLGDYVGRKAKVKAPKTSSTRLVTALTCLQFAFAVYATFLLYYMSPLVDLRTKPDFTWITRNMRQLITTPHVLGRYQDAALSLVGAEVALSTPSEVCEHEKIDFMQKKSNNARMINLKRELYDEILDFQSKTIGTETLAELMAMRSKWDMRGPNRPRVTVLLNHFKRKTLCSQLDSLLQQTLPFHHVWVLSFGSPNEQSLKRIVDSYNDSRISFISSSYDFKYYGRFQMALQTEADLVYVLDDDMIPGKKMLQILSHVAGTEKYKNSVLGSIGRILPFRQKDFTFPSYRKFGSKEAGLYLPDPAYDITIDKIVQVDFLSSSWFLSAELVKSLFIETPFTFMTGEDLHLSYQLQKYRNAGSFVLPVDPTDKETWGDSEHRLAYVSETTVIFKDIVQVRDDQWWRALTTGYVTQWAAMYTQKIDALFYAHSVDEVKALTPLLEKFRSTVGKKAYIVVSGDGFCSCEDAAAALNWPKQVCKERRFKIFDLQIGAISGTSNSEVPVLQVVYSSMKGLIKIHNPSVVITLADADSNVKKALKMASETNANGTTLVLLPRPSVSKVLWMPDLRSTALPFFPKLWREFYVYMNMRFTEDAKANPVQIPKSRTNGWQASWKKFLIDMMYLRGYVSLYPNFPNQSSFSTNHMEPGAHISAKDNVVRHDKTDFEVPLLMEDFRPLLPNAKLPPASKLPSLNLFNQPVSLKGLKMAGAKLGQDVLRCDNATEIVTAHHLTGLPLQCSKIV
ncbi:hypothetical protein GOBAR_DD24516 [Gossypium barbadense]|nr:hypothetical protein GOBAR_DD24516 [Gossypium barbadense]